MPRKPRNSQSLPLSHTAQTEKILSTEIQQYTAAAAETEMGRDVGESRVFGSLAKKPADHTTDQQKEKVRTK